jgi:hypothetical protein
VYDLVALQASVLLENLAVEIVEKTFGAGQIVLLGNKHAVVTAHVVQVQRCGGGLVVAEEAVL